LGEVVGLGGEGELALGLLELIVDGVVFGDVAAGGERGPGRVEVDYCEEVHKVALKGDDQAANALEVGGREQEAESHVDA
jgi:hypothetical protein